MKMDKNKLAVDMFNKAASVYEEKYMDVSSYTESLDLLCESIGYKHANILELACGPGNVTKYLIEKCNKYKILGTDLAPAMIELAKVNCPGVKFQILDSREISKLGRTFDAIVSGFCFPYLNKHEVTEFIVSAKQCLNSEGLLYISTMHGHYDKSGTKKSSTTGDEIYFYLYESTFIEKTLISNGFEIIDLKIQSDLTAKEETTDLIVLAKKKNEARDYEK